MNNKQNANKINRIDVNHTRTLNTDFNLLMCCLSMPPRWGLIRMFCLVLLGCRSYGAGSFYSYAQVFTR